jgi:hypothetical protein
MKTKITTPALGLAVAIAATVFAANLSGSARTIPLPVEGDPIPGVDVSIEQSPGGIIIATRKTNSLGIAKFCDLEPGKYVVKTTLTPPSNRSSNNYNNSKSNTGGIAGGTIESGSLNFSGVKPGNATIVVPGPGNRTVEVSAKNGPDPRKPKPSN